MEAIVPVHRSIIFELYMTRSKVAPFNFSDCRDWRQNWVDRTG